jgi:protoporphyrinogen oxidase
VSNSFAKKILVVGAGPMGLVAAWELLKAGHQVDVFEHDDRVGGMSASFDFDGLLIERYYHFICRGDEALLSLLNETNLTDRLRWKTTTMGYFHNGHYFPWGNPMALLSFPHLSLLSKCRYALHVLYCQHLASMEKLDHKLATPWLKRWLGSEAFQMLWGRLLDLKYYEYTDKISAAWIAARIRRVANSRKSIMAEEMGYLEGGSEVLMQKLAALIESAGGKIHLRCPVQRINCKDGGVVSVTTPHGTIDTDCVVSTVPLPYLPTIIPDLPENERSKIHDIVNIGVACVIFKLDRPFGKDFWLNISDSSIDMPGLIEYTNLCPLKDTVLYAPYYMPATHPKFQYTNQQFIDEVTHYLSQVNPTFHPSWIKSSHVHRYRYAQTVCPPNFMTRLPPMSSAIKGLYYADTAYYYPEDRSISESIQIGKRLAKNLL